MMDYRIEEADARRMDEVEWWLNAEEAEYAKAELAWETDDDSGPYPVRGFRCNWDSVRKGWNSGAKVFVLVVDDQAVGFLDGTSILEIKPGMRGRGYGRVLADFMLEQEFVRGRSVVDIGIAPYSALGFWRDTMNFTVVDDRTWYGGGQYAFKVLPRRFVLGSGERVPYAISFYTEAQRFSSVPRAFATFTGRGERMPDGSIQLPERAFGFNTESNQYGDCCVGIVLDGELLILEKAKYEECAGLGVEQDPGSIFR